MRRLLVAVVVLLSACRLSADRSGDVAATESAVPARAAAEVRWEPWSEAAFARAERENKLVLLDLEAVWCHWCHVMEETTYRDPAVVELLATKFVCLKVDQDARPDLANRYEDFGWPATILFDAKGRELAKRAGYVEPRAMASMLAAFVADPTPGPSARLATPNVADERPRSELVAALERDLDLRYDDERGGFGRVHKFVDPPSIEWFLTRALEGDATSARRARQTLEAGLALIDPAWGGVYQYSTGGVWTEPHFEKIMSFQADDLRAYSLAYAAWKDPRHLQAARDLQRYLVAFLRSPDGAFYTSQDADLVQGEHSAEYFALDDAARRELGVPRVDVHVYARENGWAIRGLCALHSATGDASALDDAVRAARWIVEHRGIDGGGFRHDEHDEGGPYLGDTLAMEQAFVALYESTAERAWLEKAVAASSFVERELATDAGFATLARSARKGVFATTVVQRDENVGVARVESALLHYTGAKEHRERAERALRAVEAPALAKKGLPSGVLLAEHELTRDPLHVTVVGGKDEGAARELFAAALAIPAVARRIEWLDETEGPLPNADTSFPPLDRPAAFVCANGRCSAPAYSRSELAARVRSLLGGGGDATR